VTFKIAVIAGDGVGPEVVAEGLKALRGAHPDTLVEEFPWGSAFYQRSGLMMPEDALETLKTFDAIYLGAIGWPNVPDHVSLWNLLFPIRKAFDQYVNLRPVKLLPGIRSPLGRVTDDQIDMLFVRENTEGEYSGAGGRIHLGLPFEVAVEVPIFTRAAIERVARVAFGLAMGRRKALVSVTKSNASRFGYVLWDEVVSQVSAEFPEVQMERVLVDAMAARMILRPDSVDVVLASNLFGDILTDLAAALQGSMGVAASANLNPERRFPSLFEPVHGSAPDIAGKGLANPIGAILSAALMLRHLGDAEGAASIERAVALVTQRREILTPDLGGRAKTADVGDAVLARLMPD